MPDDVTAIPGGFLPDEQMCLWNKSKGLLEAVDWTTKDRPFGLVEGRFRASAAAELDEHIIPEYTPISQQGQLSSCVANAGMDMLEMLLGLEKGPNAVVQLSRLFAYWTARALDRSTNKDGGTYIRALFYQLRKVGVVEEEYFPYSENAVFNAPELDLYTMASNNRIDSFYRIESHTDKTIGQLETAIRANHPVAFGISVNNDFMNYRGGGPVFAKLENPKGGHAMLITGVRKTPRVEFLIRNSWGEWWGDNGHCWISGDLIRDQGRDPWVGTRMKDLV